MKDALRFLQENDTAVISTAYGNVPYSATVHYFVDSKFNFYFITRQGTDKYLNLVINSNVFVVVGTGPKHISVQVRGKANILKGKEKQSALDDVLSVIKNKKINKWPIKEMKKFSPGPTFIDTLLKSEVVVKIVPQQLIFMNLDDEKYPESLSTEYHTILPKTKSQPKKKKK